MRAAGRAPPLRGRSFREESVMDGIRLETDRLVLRRFGVQDMAALHLLLADEEVNTFLPWFPSKSMEDTRRFYEQRLAEGKYCFAVCLKGREEPAGYIKADENGCHDFGYALRKEQE